MSESPFHIKVRKPLTPVERWRRYRRWWRPHVQFSLRTLLVAILAVALIGDYFVLQRSEKQRKRQEFQQLEQDCKITRCLQQLQVPDEVLYGDESDWQRLAHVRHDSFERHGIGSHLDFDRLLAGQLMYASQPVSPENWGHTSSSLEKGWREASLSACRFIAASLTNQPERWRDHPELFQRRIRPLVMRLLEADPSPEITVAACHALLAGGDRNPQILAALQEVLDPPYQPGLMHRRGQPDHFNRSFVYIKESALEINEQFELGLSVAQEPAPGEVRYKAGQVEFAPVATKLQDAPLIGSYPDRQELAAEIARQFQSAIVVHPPVSENSSTISLDPVQYPNSALLGEEQSHATLVFEDTHSANNAEVWLPRGWNGYKISGNGGHLQFSANPIPRDGKVTLLVWAIPEVRIFKFKASDVRLEQKQGDLRVHLNRINDHLATGTLDGFALLPQGSPQVGFFAFDHHGNALQQAAFGPGTAEDGKQHWLASFHGTIHELWVAVPHGLELLRVPLTIDTSTVAPQQVPPDPDPNVPRRYVKRDPLDVFELDWEQLGDQEIRCALGRRRYGIQLSLGQNFPSLATRAQSEIHEFGANEPVYHQWTLWNRGSLNWVLRLQNGNREKPVPVHAVFGHVRVQCLSSATIPFTKSQNDKWTPTSARELAPELPADCQVKFNHQLLTLQGMLPEGFKLLAFDQTGRQLMLDRSQQSADNTMHTYWFWGSPTRCELIVPHILDRVVPFDFKLDDLDEEAYAAYKQHVEDRQPVFDALSQIAKVRSSPSYNPRQPLAALHFLRDPSGDPINLIPRDIALACRHPDKSFDYEPAPYHGYFFARTLEDPPPSQAGGGRVYVIRIYAIPADSKLPTYVHSGDTIWQRWLNGGVPYDPGSNLERAGWVTTPRIDPERLFKP